MSSRSANTRVTKPRYTPEQIEAYNQKLAKEGKKKFAKSPATATTCTPTNPQAQHKVSRPAPTPALVTKPKATYEDVLSKLIYEYTHHMHCILNQSLKKFDAIEFENQELREELKLKLLINYKLFVYGCTCVYYASFCTMYEKTQTYDFTESHTKIFFEICETMIMNAHLQQFDSLSNDNIAEICNTYGKNNLSIHEVIDFMKTPIIHTISFDDKNVSLAEGMIKKLTSNLPKLDNTPMTKCCVNEIKQASKSFSFDNVPDMGHLNIQPFIVKLENINMKHTMLPKNKCQERQERPREPVESSTAIISRWFESFPFDKEMVTINGCHNLKRRDLIENWNSLQRTVESAYTYIRSAYDNRIRDNIVIDQKFNNLDMIFEKLKPYGKYSTNYEACYNRLHGVKYNNVDIYKYYADLTVSMNRFKTNSNALFCDNRREIHAMYGSLVNIYELLNTNINLVIIDLRSIDNPSWFASFVDRIHIRNLWMSSSEIDTLRIQTLTDKIVRLTNIIAELCTRFTTIVNNLNKLFVKDLEFKCDDVLECAIRSCHTDLYTRYIDIIDNATNTTKISMIIYVNKILRTDLKN